MQTPVLPDLTCSLTNEQAASKTAKITTRARNTARAQLSAHQHLGTPFAPEVGMLGTVLEVLLVALFALTLLCATVAVARRTTDQLHTGPTV